MARIKFGDRHFHMPRSRPIRLTVGVILVLLGFVGFLPVIGFWMIPLGILVLSFDIPIIRKLRRRFDVWFGRWRQKRNGTSNSGNPPSNNLQKNE